MKTCSINPILKKTLPNAKSPTVYQKIYVNRFSKFTDDKYDDIIIAGSLCCCSHVELNTFGECKKYNITWNKSKVIYNVKKSFVLFKTDSINPILKKTLPNTKSPKVYQKIYVNRFSKFTNDKYDDIIIAGSLFCCSDVELNTFGECKKYSIA